MTLSCAVAITALEQERLGILLVVQEFIHKRGETHSTPRKRNVAVELLIKHGDAALPETHGVLGRGA